MSRGMVADSVQFRAKEIITPKKVDSMLKPKNLSKITKSRRVAKDKDDIRIEVGGQAVPVKFLNSGGSKEVYYCELEGQPTAIAIYNLSKESQWKSILKEVENTRIIRELGLKANDLCEILPIRINGFEFPSIRMKPYNAHKFLIFDAKNCSNNDNPVVAPTNNEDCLKLFNNIIQDIAILVNNKIAIDADSINLCYTDKGFHLYINDLPNEKLFDATIDKSIYIADYISCAIGAFVNSFSNPKYNESPYLKKLGSISSVGSELEAKLKAEVSKQLKP